MKEALTLALVLVVLKVFLPELFVEVTAVLLQFLGIISQTLSTGLIFTP